MTVSENRIKFEEYLSNAKYSPTKNYRAPGSQNVPGSGTIDPLITTSPLISHYQSDISKRALIEEAYAHAKDEQWLNSIPKVHWIGWLKSQRRPSWAFPELIPSFMERFSGENKVGFSCIGYPQGISAGTNAFRAFSKDIGFIIEGDTTYAGNVDVWSQEGWRVHPKVKNWYAEEGLALPRRPMSMPIHELAANVVLCEDDLESPEIIQEMIVTNWRITGIVVRRNSLRSMLSLYGNNEQAQIALKYLDNLEENPNVPPVTFINESKEADNIYLDLARWQELSGLLNN